MPTSLGPYFPVCCPVPTKSCIQWATQHPPPWLRTPRDHSVQRVPNLRANQHHKGSCKIQTPGSRYPRSEMDPRSLDFSHISQGISAVGHIWKPLVQPIPWSSDFEGQCGGLGGSSQQENPKQAPPARDPGITAPHPMKPPL